MKFTKMQTLGKDFIVMEDPEGNFESPGSLACDLCRRRFSIGADGLLVIQPSDQGDYRLRIFNRDGSEAEMSGDALLCTCRYIDARCNYEKGMVLETKGGLKKAIALADDLARINMGEPELRSDLVPVAGARRAILSDTIRVGTRTFKFAAVGFGTPHIIIFLEEDEAVPHATAPYLEKHEFFPRGANVGFVKVINPRKLMVYPWERGMGKTFSCGSAACAAVVAGMLRDELERLPGPVDVVVPGGTLRVQWEPGSEAFLEGTAREVFTGEI
ncbi:MAG: diaminopimelate epimerase [Firmicutes bacterium]|jgi:diaminopimelate epimerase|nr:diaminopimelate epimerase [Bacillota bacterium]